MTEPVRFFVMIASESEVSMNITAAPVVILERKVAAPRLPKIVWLEPPPKPAPISAPLPVCSSTMRISARLTTTWIMIISVYMSFPSVPFPLPAPGRLRPEVHDAQEGRRLQGRPPTSTPSSSGSRISSSTLSGFTLPP